MNKKIAKRDRRKAKAWLVMHGIRQVKIRKDLQHKHTAQVSETLLGTRNDRRVLYYLLDKGCPASYLDLPDDIREAI